MARKSRSSSLSVKLSAAAIAAAVAVQVGDRGMSISERGVDALMQYEDCWAAVYRDSAGYPTAGCGHLVTDGEYRVGQRLSESEIRQLFIDDLVPFSDCVNRGINWKKTDQPKFDALEALAFNIGCGGFLRSTVLREHNRGDYRAAAKAFGLWNKERINGKLVVSKGLVNRRAKEAALYLSTYE